MTTYPDRAEVRQIGRAARRSIRGVTRQMATQTLVGHVLHLHSLVEAQSVGVFVADDGEPDLGQLVAKLWAAGRQVALPVLRDDPADRSMRFTPWQTGDVLRPGRYGIPIPPDRPAVTPDVLLVSLVGFDANGNRMGRGGGFFDRYLASTTAQIVGIGFEVQRFDAVPTEPHDIALPTIVTDHGVRHVQQFRGIRGNRPIIGKDGQSCE